jgi:hypothetical protein
MKMFRANLVAAAAIFACILFPPHHLKAQMAFAVAMEAPQVKDDLFAGTEKFAQGASDVTEVNLDKNMLGMVSKSKSKNGGTSTTSTSTSTSTTSSNGTHTSSSFGGLADKMDFIVVHSYTYDKPGMYKQEDVEVFRKKLSDGSWNCFVHTRDKDGSTDVCQRTMPDNETHELVVMTAEAKELTFVHLRGRMSLDDLGKMGGDVGAPIPGRHPMPPPPPAPPAPR